VIVHEPVDDAGRMGTDLFGIFYTGGTTGRSKGVMLSHAGVIGNCTTMRAMGLCPAECSMLIVAPLFHLAAVAALTMAMLANGTAVIMPAFDPGATLDTLAETEASDALLVPTMIQMMLNANAFDAAKLSKLQRIMYGASPIQEGTLDRIMTAAPHVDFYQCYGMTELSCTATVLTPELHKGAHREQGRHLGAGRPMPGTEVRILDADGNARPTGEVGEVVVRGPGVMLGYWNQAELTAATLRDGWMHTGDGGRLDEHGLLYVVDRIKDMIVSGGENVYSAEVESAIVLHPGVAQCAVIGVPDERWGERVHAIIVVRPGFILRVDDVLEHCRPLIAGYKCPRSIEFMATLPLSPAGKVLKTELRAPHWVGRSRNVS
jgi:long-chain acyl-CoA synthetase